MIILKVLGIALVVAFVLGVIIGTYRSIKTRSLIRKRNQIDISTKEGREQLGIYNRKINRVNGFTPK